MLECFEKGMSVCLSTNFSQCPLTRNTIPGLLMHYGSLDKYTDGALITQMNLGCGVAPLYVHKRVRSHVRSDVGRRSETQGCERDVRSWETAGNWGQESA